MLLTALIAGFVVQAAPQPPHPATPQLFSGRRSSYVQGTLNVAAGERATLRRNADGTYALTRVDRIQVADVLPPAQGSRAPLNTAEPGTIRFALHARQDVGSLLKVENSQDQGLKYAGFVVRYAGGRAQPPPRPRSAPSRPAWPTSNTGPSRSSRSSSAVWNGLTMRRRSVRPTSNAKAALRSLRKSTS